MAKTQEVCRIPLEGSDNDIIIKTVWNESNFHIILFDGVNALSGVMSEENINEVCSQLGVTVDTYLDECKAALTADRGSKNFVYKIDNYIFQWKKITHEMKILFGSVKLSSVDSVVVTLHDIINNIIDYNFQLKDESSRLTIERNTLKTDNRDLLNKVHECIRMKNDAEQELCNQFLILLNSKKQKVSALEKQLKSNGLSVDSKLEEEEECTNDEITKYYDCDTEVESDSDNCSNNCKEYTSLERSLATDMNSKKKSSSSKMVIDTSSDLNNVSSIPKRNRRNKKSDESEKNIVEFNCSETDFNFTDIKNVKDNLSSMKCGKRSIGSISLDVCDKELPGPSGIKLSKVNSRNKIDNQHHRIHLDSDEEKSCNLNNKDKNKYIEVVTKSSVPNETNPTVEHNKKGSISDKVDIISAKQIIATKETKLKSVEDILSGLIS